MKTIAGRSSPWYTDCRVRESPTTNLAKWKIIKSENPVHRDSLQTKIAVYMLLAVCCIQITDKNEYFEKETKQPSRKNPVQANWLNYIQDESLKTVVIPVGPRFQADLPDWIGPPNADKEKESKWLGTQVWPIENDTEETNEARTGKGRPEFCDCGWPGSVECVRRHVADERIKLRSELGPAFEEWRFDEMGEEDVCKQWSVREQRKFESIVKRNPPLSQGKSFLQAAMAALPSHNAHSIISYYFNVYLPRRISKETRSGNREAAGTDDEETSTPSTNSRKKRRIVY